MRSWDDIETMTVEAAAGAAEVLSSNKFQKEGWTAGGSRFDIGSDVYGERFFDEPEKEKEAKEKAQEAAFNLGESFWGMVNQALSGASSFKDLGTGLISGAGGLANQFMQATMPGGLGMLLGGLFQFGTNVLLNREKPIDVEDEIQDVRITNWDESNIQFASVRDASERSHSRRWREGWADPAARG